MARDNARCDDCRFCYTTCSEFAQRYPKMAEECIDYWPVDSWTIEDEVKND